MNIFYTIHINVNEVKRTPHPQRKILLEEVLDRAETTLLLIMCVYMFPGSIAIADCFRSYCNLENYYTLKL
ncbi:hypothetical protein HZS_7370 [Henneguya salminicola]|nr:hypothetical protein HZS_7370 [Henneguya salminicola]